MTNPELNRLDSGEAKTFPAPWFKRHPRLALMIISALLWLLIAGVAEIALRVSIGYHPGFYTGVSVENRDLLYPYGVIHINSAGFPDAEFDLSRDLRVGYFGDSVTYGVGAGYGHRVSELLEEAYPQYEHMNFGGIGLSISDAEIAWATDVAVQYGIKKAIYLFNLNDILPSAVASGRAPTSIARLANFVSKYGDWLRGRSYLYTAIRTRGKNALESVGYGFHGYLAYELFPESHEDVIRETAERMNRFATSLARQSIELIVVILPYEMQISSEAEAVYSAKGVRWSPVFLNGGTQRRILEALDPSIRVFDALEAFVDVSNRVPSRDSNGVGEYFVYDRGDKLDWNHPNRAGHRAIADYLIERNVLPEVG